MPKFCLIKKRSIYENSKKSYLYLKVSIGKELITWFEIAALLDRYSGFFE